ncbi:MAG: hypothetical protein II855_03010 [Candidatus Methanomethylophilaceae archaeon]|nr:hypothetical protein [Candidatus Methanomethylophilaceae archaeon]
MICTPLTYLAMRIAYDAHHGVLDQSGAPYVFHPFTVALLHDVVEDTDITFDDLREKGIPESVIDPLRLMTHDKDEDYMAYIERIGTDPMATKVKLSDPKHNMDASKYCRPLNDYERKREEKYRRAEEYLKEVSDTRHTRL